MRRVPIIGRVRLVLVVTMIVRINQFDAIYADQYAGWPQRGHSGPIESPWPEDMRAFELLILPHDEQNQPLNRTFRQTQLRQLIPDIITAMQLTDETIAIRLDGPIMQGEMPDALKHLTDESGIGRYSVSAVHKFEENGEQPLMSVRLRPTQPAMTALCNDANIGLERAVRFRAFSLPDDLVNPFLDISETDDERWPEILAHCGFVVGTVRAMQSLHIITRRYSPDELRTRLTRRLVGGAKV
jgi:hypothetical protein